MKKFSLTTILAGFLLFAGLTAGSVQADSNSASMSPTDTGDIATTVQPALSYRLKWRYPFTSLKKTGVHPWWGQNFGITGFRRSNHPVSYFHDGWDFSHSQAGYSPVHAIHQGTVYRVAYGNGLGWFVWVVSKDIMLKFTKKVLNVKRILKSSLASMSN